jgi:hypothetical protein
MGEFRALWPKMKFEMISRSPPFVVVPVPSKEFLFLKRCTLTYVKLNRIE